MAVRGLLYTALALGALAGVALWLVSPSGEAPAPELFAVQEEALPASAVLETVEATQNRTEQNVLPQAAEQQLFDQTKQQAENIQPEEGMIGAQLLAPGVSSEVLVPEGVTVYDLMTAVAAQFDFDFRGKSFWGLGFYVQEINGLAENPKKKMRWIYYINGETALVGVSQYTVQPNDIIEWKYEAEH